MATHYFLKIGEVMFLGPFWTYLDRSCIGFLTQVRGHIMLRKPRNSNCIIERDIDSVLHQTFAPLIILSSVYDAMYLTGFGAWL